MTMRNTATINKYSLLLTVVAGLAIPLAQGLVSGNWIWQSWSAGAYRILTVDLLWILLAVAALTAVWKVYLIAPQDPQKNSSGR